MDNLISQLPTELVEVIVGNLGLSDLRNLRLACRDVNAKVTVGRRFESFCVHKNVELRKASLNDLEARLRSPGVHQYLRHLTVTGVLLITKGLERIIREKTKPVNPEDPCGLAHDSIGNQSNYRRTPASDSEVADAESQLAHLETQIRIEDAERSAGHDLEALADLLRTVKTHCKLAALESLTLDLVVRRDLTTSLSPALGAPLRQVWEAAQHVLCVSIQAWHRSDIMIERLHIFSETESCGVQAYAFAALQSQIDFRIFGGLKALTLSISDRLLPPSVRAQSRMADRDEERPILTREQRLRMRAERDQRENDLQAQTALEEARARTMMKDPDNINGLSVLLQHTTNLEELHVHHYRSLFSPETFDPSLFGTRALLENLAHSAPLPNLRRLSFLNVDVDVSSLLMMLKNSPRLTSLELRLVKIAVHGGRSMRTLFDYITSRGANLTHVYLDNIFEASEQGHLYITCFTPGTTPGYSITNDEERSARLERLGLLGNNEWDLFRPSANGWNEFELLRREHVLRGIDYQLNSRYPVGSVQNSQTMEQVRRHMGPVDLYPY
ncbi:hypothetical protein HBI25_137710 [Parastagonospora nodorum]|nr:hypothetical protein HBH47_202110 [Parastagonospora nodorum]KAH4171183.1 hypothetical protein HBH43_095070 [Parastagonospora nodorum]KAH4222008.1 hypothetical protein HBI06_153830 [Parastagonospora nodorum]KAH4239406.1 hypothetical protein HBI05_116210 [Parastagonospora nodorum]KAH4257400.1 hypothetical protein HBI03_153610 [Parastagonospora nodorum]